MRCPAHLIVPLCRVKLFPSQRAWGKLVWKGQVQFEGAERRIKSTAKREWRYLCQDPQWADLISRKPKAVLPGVSAPVAAKATSPPPQ